MQAARLGQLAARNPRILPRLPHAIQEDPGNYYQLMHGVYNYIHALTSALLSLECSIDCICRSVGHHQNLFSFIF